MIDSVFDKCVKCDGRGRIDAYSHIDNGICFECGGQGVTHSGRKLTNLKTAHPFTVKQINDRAKTFAATQVLEIDEWISNCEDMMTTCAQIKHLADTKYDHLNPANQVEVDDNFDFFAILDA